MHQETVDVDRESLVTLTQESLEKSMSILKLEKAGADLYKALQAGRDRGLQKFPHRYTRCEKVSHNLVFRHGRRNGTALRIQDVQFSVLQANFRLSVHYVHCSGILVHYPC